MRGGQSERRPEGAGEVRLVGESRVARDLDERSISVNPFTREVETAHEQIAVVCLGRIARLRQRGLPIRRGSV